jgi:hypothetical protein
VVSGLGPRLVIDVTNRSCHRYDIKESTQKHASSDRNSSMESDSNHKNKRKRHDHKIKKSNLSSRKAKAQEIEEALFLARQRAAAAASSDHAAMTESQTADAIAVIPGFVYDPITLRYYKSSDAVASSSSSSSSSASAIARSSSSSSGDHSKPSYELYSSIHRQANSSIVSLLRSREHQSSISSSRMIANQLAWSHTSVVKMKIHVNGSSLFQQFHITASNHRVVVCSSHTKFMLLANLDDRHPMSPGHWRNHPLRSERQGTMICSICLSPSDAYAEEAMVGYIEIANPNDRHTVTSDSESYSLRQYQRDNSRKIESHAALPSADRYSSSGEFSWTYDGLNGIVCRDSDFCFIDTRTRIVNDRCSLQDLLGKSDPRYNAFKTYFSAARDIGYVGMQNGQVLRHDQRAGRLMPKSVATMKYCIDHVDRIKENILVCQDITGCIKLFDIRYADGRRVLWQVKDSDQKIHSRRFWVSDNEEFVIASYEKAGDHRYNLGAWDLTGRMNYGGEPFMVKSFVGDQDEDDKHVLLASHRRQRGLGLRDNGLEHLIGLGFSANKQTSPILLRGENVEGIYKCT